MDSSVLRTHLSGPPRRPVAVPSAVQALAADQLVRCVWQNELGGLTFELGAEPKRRFVKWAPDGSALNHAAEGERLRWAGRYVSVPRVLDQGADGAGSWLVTAALPGESAVSEHWRADPSAAVTAVGRGLRVLHDSLPVGECPFSWSVHERLGNIHTTPSPETREYLDNPPPIDHLVVCHGDACAPNTIVTDEGGCSGHVDLGALGVADRWADLAIATWSTEWNYGRGWEDALLNAYRIAPNENAIRYYRLLWDHT